MLLELSDALAAMTVLALLGTLIFTGPLSLLLLLLYRRAVLRGMRLRGTDSRTVASVADTDSLSPTTSPATLSLATDARRMRRGGEELYEEARRRQTRMAARHALAGAVYGAGWFAGAIWLLPDEMTPAGVAALLIASLFPGLLAWTTVKEPGRFAWLIWLAYFAAFSVLLGQWEVAAPRPPSPFVQPDAGTTLAFLFLVYPLLLLARSLGAVGLLVLAFVGVLLFGYGLVIALIILGLGGGGAFRDPALMTDLYFRFLSLSGKLGGDEGTFKLVLLLASLAFFVVPGVLGVRWLGRRYRARKLSDQSLAIAASYVACSLLWATALGLSARYGTFWAIVPLGACALTLAILAVQPAFPGVGSPPRPPRLLFLRVFALGRKRRRVFRRLESFWRQIGPIRLISGPDLALSTVEPHEVIDFLTRKLAERFIDGTARSNEVRWHENERPDADGRFRVDEYFCHADVWQAVFAELATSADVVVMDARGFGAAHAGSSFEIEAMLRYAPPSAVVLLIDRGTDRSLLEALFTRGLGGMRYPPLDGSVQLAALDCGIRTDWSRLHELVCSAAAGSRAARRGESPAGPRA
jgi:hypothetical protein